MAVRKLKNPIELGAIRLVKAIHLHWIKPAVQLRLNTKDDTEVVIQAVDGAYNLFKDSEPLRAYCFVPPRSCIKASNARDEQDVPGDYAVRLQYSIEIENAKKCSPIRSISKCIDYF